MRTAIHIGAICCGAALAFTACDMPTSVSCKEDHTCWSGGVAGADQGGTSSGGTSSKGGTSVVSFGGTNAVTPIPCNGDCSGDAPVCNEDTDKCVECLKGTDCKNSTKTVCSSLNTCVECTEKTDCTFDPSRSICETSTGACVSCVNNTDCTNVSAPACDAGSKTCVGCLVNTDCKDSAKAVCDTTGNTCVSCLKTADCTFDAAHPVCKTASSTCVQCLANSNCTTAEASLCDTATNTCGKCSADVDCVHIPGKNVCSSGSCVACTVSNEAACGTHSCNPATNACTTTTKGSVDYCNACVADSECIGGDNAAPTARCVPMTFNGTARGAYCLQRASVGCASPYKVNFSAVSLSGAVAESYCGINQTSTTCEAVASMIASNACTVDGDCGIEGGFCKNFAVSTAPPDLRCTIPCSETLECTGIRTCTSTVPYCH